VHGSPVQRVRPVLLGILRMHRTRLQQVASRFESGAALFLTRPTDPFPSGKSARLETPLRAHHAQRHSVFFTFFMNLAPLIAAIVYLAGNWGIRCARRREMQVCRRR
jgi:hypothetical protein